MSLNTLEAEKTLQTIFRKEGIEREKKKNCGAMNEEAQAGTGRLTKNIGGGSGVPAQEVEDKDKEG